MIQPSLMLLPLPLMQVSGMRPLCCPEASLAAPAPRTVAASGSPAPAPCVQIYTQPSNYKQLKDSSFFKRHIRKKTANYESPFNRPNIYYKKFLKDGTLDILYPIRRPMQCPILLPRVTSASSPTGPVTVSLLQFFCRSSPSPIDLSLKTKPNMCTTLKPNKRTVL